MSFMVKDLIKLREIVSRMAQQALNSAEVTRELFTTSDLSVREHIWRSINNASSVLEVLKDEVVVEILSYIARYQPLGRELRVIRTLINVAYDIYRISRYCREIARIDSLLAPESGVYSVDGLGNLFDEVLKALDAAFNDLNELSSKRSKLVREVDNLIDAEYMKVLKEVTSSSIVTKEKAVKALLMRHIERIVDHAGYIESYVTDLQS